jgi:hypothetical protein
MRLIRRLRGVAGTGLAWVLGWSVIAWPIFLVLDRGGLFTRLVQALRMASYAGLAGAVSGATFAVLVVTLERQRTLAAFPTRRSALWGAVAGSGYSFAVVTHGLTRVGQSVSVITSAVIVGAVLGVATARLMLLLAQRAAERARGAAPATVASSAN